MTVAAGLLGILYGIAHAGTLMVKLRQKAGARVSPDIASIPGWARVLWLVLALVTPLGSIVHLASPSVVTAATMAAGATGIWLLAIANGFWIHGRPTVRHHLVRGVILLVLLLLIFLNLPG